MQSLFESRLLPVHSRPVRISIDALLNPAESEEIGTQQPRTPGQQYHNGYHNGQFSPEGLRYRPDQAIPGHEETMSLTRQSGFDHGDTGPYRYERFDSVSSTSTNQTESRRPPRPKYEEEEMYFIWYHRVDLEKEWKEVQECFNRQFPARQRRGFQGIQCKFYRFIREKRCPTVREQRRIRDGEFMARGRSRSGSLPRYGVVQWCGTWYPWMKPEHAAQLHRSRPTISDDVREAVRRVYVNSSTGTSFPPQARL
ncbi:hypothetical protein VTN77DRAFT_6206 [Rasamsonia byssochlamydoides]|uniref:uncharacterized protein n=1 Tax=Rasamsonia byssochlamydoides TaxID=89139 RepID=UPI00374358FB